MLDNAVEIFVYLIRIFVLPLCIGAISGFPKDTEENITTNVAIVDRVFEKAIFKLMMMWIL